MFKVIVFSTCIILSGFLSFDAQGQVVDLRIKNPMFLWYNKPAIIESKILKDKILIGFIDNDKNINIALCNAWGG